MTNILKKHLFIIIVLSSFSVQAQQVEFSQFYSNPLHLNPALAGISFGPRIALTYRNQWPELTPGTNGGFSTYAIGYDQHIEAISGGIGIQLISDRIAGDKIVSNSVAATYAYQLRIKDKVGVKIGLTGVYKHRYIHFHDLTFLDQIDPITGFHQSVGVPNSSTEPAPSNFNKNIFNANAGVVFFNKQYYGGLAFNNIVPEQDFYGNTSLRLRMAAHAGALYKIGKNKYQQKYFIAPQILYAYQNNFHQLTAGSMFGYDFIYLSLWGRHTINNFDAVIVGLGFKKSIIRFGYSYDINVSKLKGTSGSHEITFVFNFTKEDNSLNPSYRQDRVPCPYYLDF